MLEIGDNVEARMFLPLEGNTIAPPLKPRHIYPVKAVYICHCGNNHIDVGLKSEYNYIRCHECKQMLPDESIHWCHPSRFVLVRKNPIVSKSERIE